MLPLSTTSLSREGKASVILLLDKNAEEEEGEAEEVRGNGNDDYGEDETIIGTNEGVQADHRADRS